MNIDPFKSALPFGEIGETSLAVPSDGASYSGQRRVREQVSTMRRGKSKLSVRGSAGTISPTSPKFDSVFYESKYSPTSAVNGSAFTYDSSMANGSARMKQQKKGEMQRSVSAKSASYQRNQTNSMLPKSLPSLNYISIQPDYGPPTPKFSNSGLSSAHHTQAKTLERRHSHLLLNSTNQIISSTNVQRMSNGNHFFGSQINSGQPLSPQSNLEPRPSVISSSKMEMNGLNGEAHSADFSLVDAVQYLNTSDETLQLLGATYIQHKAFIDDKAKSEIRRLQGIPLLVALLKRPNPKIQDVSASALRTVVYKDQANKEEVQREGGVKEAVTLLQSTASADTQKHVTGLLWNLSSAESVRPELLREALPVLTHTILQPNADPSLITSDSHLRSESFSNATGCLLNLSSGKMSNRQALRNCEGLIDSLVKYVQICSEDDLLDGKKSLENCVCILHNLTYQLDTEVPSMFSKLNSLANENQLNTPDTGPIGCFSNQSRKAQQESNIHYPQMDASNPEGTEHLIHTETLHSYLKLMSLTESQVTQDACCGILQSLTAKKGIVSDVMSYTIVQRLKGEQYISPLLESQDAKVKNAVINLVGNLSRNPDIQRQLARHSLPHIVKALSSLITKGENLSPASDSSIAMACHVTNNLMRAEPETGKRMLNSDLIKQLNEISENDSLPKASKAAGILLHSLWSDKTIQPFLKKRGLSKKSFVNDTTSAALKSIQVID